MTTSKLVGLCGVAAIIALWLPVPASAGAAPEDPTFSRDVAPILQRSCQKCHRPNSLAPMSLISYQEVRPWARAIKYRTGLRDKPGVMPPWYIEKNIGIQQFKDDWSLSDDEVATIARWADNGAPQGDPADMPEPPPFIDVDDWEIGAPDLIVSSPAFEIEGDAPDWWGSLGTSETGLTEDRYVAAIEYKERNDLQRGVRSDTVGGLFIVHHSALYSIVEAEEGEEQGAPLNWPVHEVGRNADVFDENAGRLLEAGSTLLFPTTHLHANGTDTRAHIDVAFKFHPKGYEPEKEMQLLFFGNGPDLDIRPMEADQRADAYFTLPENSKISVFEPHMHAPGVRMCLEGGLGHVRADPQLRRLRPQLGARLQVRRRRRPAAPEGDHPAPHRVLQQLADQPERGRSAQLVRLRPPLGRQHVHQPDAGHLPGRRGVRSGSRHA